MLDKQNGAIHTAQWLCSLDKSKQRVSIWGYDTDLRVASRVFYVNPNEACDAGFQGIHCEPTH